jgi:Arc/MetJ family transcription regulator
MWCILIPSRRHILTRLSADIDPEILDEAQRLAGAKTKRETIDRALREFVAHRRRHELSTLAGASLVEMSLDDLTTWRSKSEVPE